MIQSNTCIQCESKGPTLLPVRYAVIPDGIVGKQSLPEWASNNAFPNMHGYKYVLRLLSEGYLYVFYTDRGGYWECWKINNKGEFYKQPDATCPQNGSTECNSAQHNRVNVEFITLRKTALENNVWVAFAHHAWSRITLDKYSILQNLREERMQKISPSIWRSGKGTGIISASKETLNNISDYQMYNKLPYELVSSLRGYSVFFLRSSKTRNARLTN